MIEYYTTKTIMELEFPGGDEEGFDSVKWVKYDDYITHVDESNAAGYEAGMEEGYEDGYYDGSHSKVDRYSGIPDALEACKSHFNKMRDRDPFYDEYEDWIINYVNANR
jgi:hypothetical protein